MPQLVVIRHSKALANEQGILMGAKLDSPLSKNGQELAHQKGQRLRVENFAPSKVYTSTLQRAKQTAGIILEELNSTIQIQELPELNERDFGEHDGKPYKSVLEAFGKYGHNPPTIEPVINFVARVQNALDKILAETVDTALVVTHSNPEMVLRATLLKTAPVERFWELGDSDYCEGFVYEY